MSRDIIDKPQYEVRFRPSDDKGAQLQKIRQETTKIPARKIAAEGDQPERDEPEREEQQPISKERAFEILREKGGTGNKDEGVFEVILREDGSVFKEQKINESGQPEENQAPEHVSSKHPRRGH